MNVHYNKHVRVLLFSHKKPYSTCSELCIGRVRMSVKEYDSESHNRYPFSLICDHQTCHSRFCKFSQLHTSCSDLCTTNIHTSVAKIWFGPFFTKRYISMLCAEICAFSNSGLAGVIFYLFLFLFLFIYLFIFFIFFCGAPACGIPPHTHK